MEKKYELICISCPVGCHLEVSEKENGLFVKGNQCKKGEAYAICELKAPTRVLTTTVRINNGFLKRLPVRTNSALPKDKLFQAMEIINQVIVTAPIKVGELIVENILGTGVDIIASRSMEVSGVNEVAKATQIQSVMAENIKVLVKKFHI